MIAELWGGPHGTPGTSKRTKSGGEFTPPQPGTCPVPDAIPSRLLVPGTKPSYIAEYRRIVRDCCPQCAKLHYVFHGASFKRLGEGPLGGMA